MQKWPPKKKTAKAKPSTSSRGKKTVSAKKGAAGDVPNKQASAAAGNEAIHPSGLKHYAMWAYLDHILKEVSPEQLAEISAKITQIIDQHLEE